MEKPFKFIECKILCREEFFITKGVHPTNAIFYIKQGRFLLKMDGREDIIGPGDCVIFPDDVTFLRNVIEPVSFISFKFKINEKCSFSLPIPNGKITLKNSKRFKESVEKYEELMNINDARAIYYREHLMEDLLLQIVSETSGQEIYYDSDVENTQLALGRCHDAVVNAAVQYICSNIDEKLKIQDICKVARTNTSTLNFKFRRELKMSIGEFITYERMSEARKLLINTTYSVSDIAAKCGYDNVYYFSTAFKKHNGMSPTQLRANYR